jgi:hypothetical protein
MPNTTNFNWPTPADTDLVKDGAAAIRNLGNGVDTSLVDLKGGTTGQILSKASNADMDFAFITPNVGDLTEVQAGTGISVASGTGPIPVVTNTVATAFDAKGDLVVGTGADTFAKLTVGTNGHTLVADSAETTGLKWQAAAAGGFTSIASGSLTGSSVTISSIPATYYTLILEIIDFYNTSDETLLGTVNSTQSIYNNSLAFTQATNLNSTYMELTDSTYNNSDEANYAIIEFPAYYRTNVHKLAQGMCIYRNAANTQYATSQQRYGIGTLSAISSITIQTSANFSGGTYQLWGVK